MLKFSSVRLICQSNFLIRRIFRYPALGNTKRCVCWQTEWSYVRASIRSSRNILRLRSEALILYIYVCWQDTFASQIASKSSTFLTFIFKVKDSNRIHWPVHTWNTFESLNRQNVKGCQGGLSDNSRSSQKARRTITILYHLAANIFFDYSLQLQSVLWRAICSTVCCFPYNCGHMG